MASKRDSILLIPKTAELNAVRSGLPKFKPHDLRALVKEAVAGGNAAFVSAFRRRNQEQMNDLLRSLGVDPSLPDAYKRGFFLLAHYSHRLGHLAWYPRRTNRNAATWTHEHDWVLLMGVGRLKAEGLSETKAVKAIASDPKLGRYLPYREQTNRKESHFSRQNAAKRRAAAIWRRLQQLKKDSSSGESLLNQLAGTFWRSQSDAENYLRHIDFPILSGASGAAPVDSMKNGTPSS
jgi:hypothetical protein